MLYVQTAVQTEIVIQMAVVCRVSQEPTAHCVIIDVQIIASHARCLHSVPAAQLVIMETHVRKNVLIVWREHRVVSTTVYATLDVKMAGITQIVCKAAISIVKHANDTTAADVQHVQTVDTAKAVGPILHVIHFVRKHV
jgi:hypothetical protein